MSRPRGGAGAALAALLALGLAGCGGNSGRVMKGPEIQALFAGKTVQGRHLKRGYTFESYYEPTGTYRSHQSDKQAPRTAKWRVQGDRICVTWDDTKEDLCRNMVETGPGRYTKMLIKGNGVWVPIVEFESFAAGNPKQL